MRRQIVLLILFMAAVGYAIYTYWPLFSVYLPGAERLAPARTEVEKVEVAQPAAKPAPSPATPEAQKEAKKEAPKPAKEAEEKLIDPFSLRVAVRLKSEVKAAAEEKKEEKKIEEPVLEGIWVDSGMRVAFISEQALTEGGIVLGWRVKRITKTEVVLVRGKATKTLKLEAILQ